MDINRMKSISEAKIKAGKQVSNVRNTLKQIEHRRQDVQEDLSEAFKPIVTAQEEVKQTIDEKQDELLKQLQKTKLESLKILNTKALKFQRLKLVMMDMVMMM